MIWKVCRTPAVVKGEARGGALSERNGKFGIGGSSRGHTSLILKPCTGPSQGSQ